MLRRTLAVVTALLVPSGLLVATSSSDAWALIGGQGIANCQIFSGHGTVSPGLTPAGSASGVKIHFTAMLDSAAAGGCPNSNVTVPAGDTIIGGKVTGSGFYNGVNADACSNFNGPDVVGKIVVTIKWTMSGAPIAPTRIVYTSNPGTVTGAPFDIITLSAPPGSATKTGSFVAPPTLNTVQLKTDLPGPGCPPGPTSTFNVTGGNVLV